MRRDLPKANPPPIPNRKQNAVVQPNTNNTYDDATIRGNSIKNPISPRLPPKPETQLPSKPKDEPISSASSAEQFADSDDVIPFPIYFHKLNIISFRLLNPCQQFMEV